MKLSNKKLFALITGIVVLYGILYWTVGGYFVN